MAILIKMIKIEEDVKFVSYLFHMLIDLQYMENKGDLSLVRYKRTIGFCKFNKETYECVMDSERSDKYFLKMKGYFDRVCIQLIRLSKAGEGFPDYTAYEA